MADPLASERAMTYSEPPSYPSSSFVSVQTTERPPQQSQWWGPGQRFTITIKSPGQNEFMDTNKMRLQFSVFCVVQRPTPLPSESDQTNQLGWEDVQPGTCLPTQRSADWNGETAGLYCAHPSDAACTLPGAPSWGVPFFNSVRVQIPGLPLESFLTARVESQYMVATRLLCASGEPYFDQTIGKLSFGILGQAWAAGARSVVDRLSCVTASNVVTDRTYSDSQRSVVIPNNADDNVRNLYQRQDTPPFGSTSYRGFVSHYSVPLSLFSHIFNMASNLIPLGFYSTSSDTCSFTFETAAVNDALNNINADRPDIAGPATYWIIDPCLSYTKLQISNPTILAATEALYRGRMSIPITPQINIPLAFVMKFINYIQTTTSVNSPTGFWSISMPANQPSARGIALRFSNNDYQYCGLFSGTMTPGVAGTVVQNAPVNLKPAWRVMNATSGTQTQQAQWNGRYLLTLAPRLRNLQIRIASFRCPLDPLFDLAYSQTDVIPGLATTSATSADPLNGAYPFSVSAIGSAHGPYSAPSRGQIDVPITYREALRLYTQGKHLFSPFAVEEHPHDAALSYFYCSPLQNAASGAAPQIFQGCSIVNKSIGPESNRGAGTAFNQLETATRIQCSRTIAGSSQQVRFGYTNPWAKAGKPKVPLPYWTNTGLFVIPFETLGAVYNHRDDVFSLRGLDLRSISSIEITGEIVGLEHASGYGVPDTYLVDATSTSVVVAPGGTNGTNVKNGTTNLADANENQFYGPFASDAVITSASTQYFDDQVTTNSWFIRAMLAYDQEHVLLPGRIDVEAQFSLLPTGATAIPSGGAPAM